MGNARKPRGLSAAAIEAVRTERTALQREVHRRIVAAWDACGGIDFQLHHAVRALDEAVEARNAGDAPVERRLERRMHVDVAGRFAMAEPCPDCGHTRCGPECSCSCAGQRRCP